jgi:hypothetical protein
LPPPPQDWPRPQDHYDSAEEALAVMEKLQHQKLKSASPWLR